MPGGEALTQTQKVVWILEKETKHQNRLHFQSTRRAPFKKTHPVSFFLIIAAGITAFLLYFAYGRLPLYPCWLFCVSIVTFIFYGYDKHQSGKDGAWRVPEAVLHLLSLAGGFVGAFLGRRYFRHKTQKITFIIVIVLSILLHIALFLYF